jgi:hypothetical protein
MKSEFITIKMDKYQAYYLKFALKDWLDNLAKTENKMCEELETLLEKLTDIVDKK